MRKILLVALCVTLTLLAWQALRIADVHAQASANWLQWGRTPQHNGDSTAVGQNPQAQLADVTYDPFVAQEQAEAGGPLLEHYQAPLIDGDTTFMEYKTGVYTPCNPPGSGMPYPCGPDAWGGEIWNERAFHWENGSFVEKWNFQSDWKPEPNSNLNDVNSKSFGLSGWEPVFHAAVSGGHVFVPGASGSVYKLNEGNGSVAVHITPFGSDPNTYISGPLTVDGNGNVYYNAMSLDPSLPWTTNVNGAWLVKIAPDGAVRPVKYETLVPGAQISCFSLPCGSQRGAINVAPAISPDGKTLYTVSRSHFFPFVCYLIAVNVSDLTPKWNVKLFGLLAKNSVEDILDQASSTPAVAPDGSILFGAIDSSPSGRGDLMKFSPDGQFLAAFNFGWDETPAIYPHDGTYSVIIKNNYYATSGPYYISQLDSNLRPEWHFKDETIDSTHPNGYEWCVNAPAVDANGTVYANSEDGNVYVINQGGTLKGKIFLRVSIEAAYTPIAIGPDGRLYTENDGDMFVIGNK
jgi:outer membrane protein assembly factor BamB